MSLSESALPGPDEEAGPPSQADLRMAELLGDKTRAFRVRDKLREEGTPVADDLLGRLNALDFIDSVIGEDYELPSRIGDFEITGVLGRGGMGTVYKAYQATLDREVALKVLAPRFSSDVTMRKRFRTEAKATAAMHHQHIVPIYGYGEASGHLFFAMELVAGVSLDKHITVARRKSEAAMDPLEAARKFSGVADALALAHKRQILHRDVKPGNLLVHADGTLALADFGLSKFLGEVSAHLTSVGGFLGTLHYSPPEQARGEDLGPASDLYSLGVTIFEVVTGKLPLYGQSAEAMLHALLNDEPLRLRDLMPRAPRDLDAVLAKLLQKDPRDRYQDGEALALDLLRIAEGEPVRIRRQGLVTRLYRRARRNPVMTATVGILMVLLVVTGLWFQSLWENESISREKRGREALATASVAVAREVGPLRGPFGVLNALTGMASAEPEQPSKFLANLEDARRNLPENIANIERYREAYRGRALLQARIGGAVPVDLLKQGAGVRALRCLTSAIERLEVEQFEKSDLTEDLGMRLDQYNLYLVRAIAGITQAVSDPQQALIDLKLASFIRSGAVLPQVLTVFLEHRERPQRLIEALTAMVGGAAPEVRQAIGEFTLAFAGICPPPGCQLMRFPMDYATRKLLTTKAFGWLGGDAAKLRRDEWYYGLHLELARHAERILANLGDAQVMDAELQAGRAMLVEISDHSLLTAWRYTYDLLADEDTTRDSLDVEARLRGAIHYVRVVQRTLPIDQGEAILRSLEPQLQGLLEPAESSPDTPGNQLRALATELRARVFTWIGDPTSAQHWADAWLKRDDKHPEAHLCKVCALVRARPKDQAEYLRVLRHVLDVQEIGVGLEGLRARMRRRVEHMFGRLVDAAARQWTGELLKRLSASG